METNQTRWCRPTISSIVLRVQRATLALSSCFLAWFQRQNFFKCFPDSIYLFIFWRNGKNQFSSIQVCPECSSSPTYNRLLFICWAGQVAPDDIRPIIHLIQHHFTITANVLVGRRRQVTFMDGLNNQDKEHKTSAMVTRPVNRVFIQLAPVTSVESPVPMSGGRLAHTHLPLEGKPVRLAHPHLPVEGKQVLAPKTVVARPPWSYVVVICFYARQKDKNMHVDPAFKLK